MSRPRSFNYIKAHRKRWNFNQQELAYLVGYGNNSTVSRIEKGKQDPSLSDMIMFEVFFGKSAAKLFPDLYMRISNKLLQRLAQFEQHLKEAPSTQSNIDKLDVIQSVRRSIAHDNRHRV